MYWKVVAKVVARKRALLRMGLLVGLILVLCACGSGAQAQGRKIPERSLQIKAKPLPAGKYVSDEFKPAMSFRLGEGWSNWEPGESLGFQAAPEGIVETRDSLSLFTYKEHKLVRTPNGGGFSWVEFMVIRKVYRLVSSSKAKEEPAPKNMLSWLQNNPNLDAEDPEPVSIGGKKGMQFDAVASRIPQDYFGNCNVPCLPIVKGSGLDFSVFKNAKVRFIVLDKVDGKTVTIAIAAPAVKFDEFLGKAQKVIKTVKWTGT